MCVCVCVTISVGVCLYLNNYLHVMSVCVCYCQPVRVLDSIYYRIIYFTVVLEQMESIFEHTKSFKRGHGASRR